MLEQPELSDELYLHVQTRNATRVLSEEVSAPYWPGFFDTLQRMIDVAGERLLFMLLPAEPQVEDAVWDEVLARAEHPLERDGAQRRVGAWLAERGVAYLDVMPALLATPALEDGRRHVFHVRDTHLNARGNEVVGRALAAFLAEQVTP